MCVGGGGGLSWVGYVFGAPDLQQSRVFVLVCDYSGNVNKATYVIGR